MLRSAVVGKLLAIVALVAALAVVGSVLLGAGGPDYVVRARFADAGQLVKGNLVQVAGVKVGSVHGIRLTPDGQAEIAMKIDDAAYRPLRRGTRAIIRQASLSGVANRYIDLQLPPGYGDRDDPVRRRHRPGRDDLRGRPRPALQHVRLDDAQGAQRADPRRERDLRRPR